MTQTGFSRWLEWQSAPIRHLEDIVYYTNTAQSVVSATDSVYCQIEDDRDTPTYSQWICS